MTTQEEQDERNKRLGWLTSLSVQLVLLIVCYLIIAWKEPYPPIPEYGIELSFSSSSGSSAAQVSNEQERSSSSDAAQNEQEQEVQELPQVMEESEENESTQVETADTETESVEPINADAVETVEQLSEVPVEDESQPAQALEEPKKESVEESVKSETEQEPVEEQKVEARALMGTGQKKGSGQKEGEIQSESKELDSRALYGSGGADVGNREGANLALAGWKWDFEPKPDDNSPATGKVTYKIKVDNNGNLTNIQLEQTSLPPAIERKYREAVLKLTFTKTAEYKAAQSSEGTITFIITSK